MEDNGFMEDIQDKVRKWGNTILVAVKHSVKVKGEVV